MTETVALSEFCLASLFEPPTPNSNMHYTLISNHQHEEYSYFLYNVDLQEAYFLYNVHSLIHSFAQIVHWHIQGQAPRPIRALIPSTSPWFSFLLTAVYTCLFAQAIKTGKPMMLMMIEDVVPHFNNVVLVAIVSTLDESLANRSFCERVGSLTNWRKVSIEVQHVTNWRNCRCDGEMTGWRLHIGMLSKNRYARRARVTVVA